ncbi:hypothetical protein M8C21_011246 [Ambrosia artemisiifolia]|uniref:Uncharacterized protein n=1 Tax=Ambrosia artemisiifolia TaxID=4212 RepID=A0AAD5CKG3_AMBAR|nr:hypothetical protein M8C21_011246 [Ambrosia artemisiifolia]
MYIQAPGAELVNSSIRKSLRLQSKKGLSSYSKYVFKSYHSNSKCTNDSSKTSLCKENSVSEGKIQEEKKHQFLHRNEVNGAFSANTVSMKSSTVVPSFEYHVQAKDGIRLVVDLNMKRSDWLKSMGKTVCVCQDHSKPAFESFRKEVEGLRDRNNLKVSSPDKNAASDASMSSCVENKFSVESTSRETEKTLPSDVEKEVITLSGSKQCWSKVDQNSELVPGSFENSEEVQLSDFSSPQKALLHVQERIKSAEGIEGSGREENAFVTSASDDEPKRKKRYYKSDHIHGQSHERILRSTLGGKVLEHDGVSVWRSSRLHSKVL